ncbi:MAG: hypothetical protein ACK59B_12260 [Alphaproteobacteria bacterium]|jgi:hypothetical protein
MLEFIKMDAVRSPLKLQDFGNTALISTVPWAEKLGKESVLVRITAAAISKLRLFIFDHLKLVVTEGHPPPPMAFKQDVTG